MSIPSRDARLDALDEARRQVIGHPLARGLNPAEVSDHLASLDAGRFPRHHYANRGPRPYLQPRGGFPSFDDQRALTNALYEAGADFIPLTIDSYTRQNEYETANQLLQRSEFEERDYLNGYPLISHGYELTRELYRNIVRPISLRHGTPDARLLVEVAIASGITEIEGGGICYCLPYSEGFPLDRSLLYWQYVDRVCALYSTSSTPINRESFGPLTATLVPPAVAIATQIIEALLAAEQGVVSFAVSFSQTGSLVQDVATAKVMKGLARATLDQFGFGTMDTFLVYHQWMGQFPENRNHAAALIACSGMISSMVGADKVVVKTVDEALGVPTADVNAQAVDSVKYVLDRFSGLDEVTSPLIDAEEQLITSEVQHILNAIFDLSGDAFWESVFRAFRFGWLDIPFSPHADNPNKLIAMRDTNGSIRISEPGNFPICDADLHRERTLLEGRVRSGDKIYQQLLTDITLMAK